MFKIMKKSSFLMTLRCGQIWGHQKPRHSTTSDSTLKNSDTQNTPPRREELIIDTLRPHPASTLYAAICLFLSLFSIGKSKLAAYQDSYKNESQKTPLRLGNWSGGKQQHLDKQKYMASRNYGDRRTWGD